MAFFFLGVGRGGIFKRPRAALVLNPALAISMGVIDVNYWGGEA